jgi:hypothetical protein
MSIFGCPASISDAFCSNELGLINIFDISLFPLLKVEHVNLLLRQKDLLAVSLGLDLQLIDKPIDLDVGTELIISVSVSQKLSLVLGDHALKLQALLKDFILEILLAHVVQVESAWHIFHLGHPEKVDDLQDWKLGNRQEVYQLRQEGLLQPIEVSKALELRF